MGLDKTGAVLWYHWQKKIIAPEKITRSWKITSVLTIFSTNFFQTSSLFCLLAHNSLEVHSSQFNLAVSEDRE